MDELRIVGTVPRERLRRAKRRRISARDAGASVRLAGHRHRRCRAVRSAGFPVEVVLMDRKPEVTTLEDFALPGAGA
jgi:hypothetical protein